MQVESKEMQKAKLHFFEALKNTDKLENIHPAFTASKFANSYFNAKKEPNKYLELYKYIEKSIFN